MPLSALCGRDWKDAFVKHSLEYVVKHLMSATVKQLRKRKVIHANWCFMCRRLGRLYSGAEYEICLVFNW